MPGTTGKYLLPGHVLHSHASPSIVLIAISYPRVSEARGDIEERHTSDRWRSLGRWTDTGSFPCGQSQPTMELGFSRPSLFLRVRRPPAIDDRFAVVLIIAPRRARRHDETTIARHRVQRHRARPGSPPSSPSSPSAIYLYEARNSRHAHTRTLLCSAPSLSRPLAPLFSRARAPPSLEETRQVLAGCRRGRR